MFNCVVETSRRWWVRGLNGPPTSGMVFGMPVINFTPRPAPHRKMRQESCFGSVPCYTSFESPFASHKSHKTVAALER